MRSTPVLRFSAAHSPPAARRGAGLSPLRRFFPRLAPCFLGPPVLRICTVRRVGPIRKLHAYTRSIQTMVLRFFSAVLPSFFFAFAYASVPGPREKTRLCPVAAREWPFYPQSTRKDKGRVGGPPVVRLHDSAPVQDNNERAWDSSFVCLPFLHSGLFASRHAPSHDFFYSVGAPLMLLSYSDLLVFRCFAA